MLDNSCLFCLLKAMHQNYSAFLKKVVTDYFGLVLRGLPEVSKIVFLHMHTHNSTRISFIQTEYYDCNSPSF